MQAEEQREPALVVEYTDPLEGFRGWLVIDTLDHRLCAGGLRVQQGLTRNRLARMARNMTCKMRICGLRVDGAKSGIDYDPAAPGRKAAVARFVSAISPYIRSRYSVGPDLNMEMAELEAIAGSVGLPSVKMAVALAQGWELEYFMERYAVLGQEIEGLPLGRIRVGYGVAVAALTVLDHLGIPYRDATVAVQGFGALARAALFGLARKGVRIVALADAEKCIMADTPAGLDMQQLLAAEGPLLPGFDPGSGARVVPRDDITTVACDILVPAAVENTVNEENAGRLRAKAVVPGANLAVTAGADRILYERGVLVLPDLLTGSGGSLSMEGLFGPAATPDPLEVLAHVEHRMAGIVTDILARSRTEKIPPSLAALRACTEKVAYPGARPYGDPRK